MIRRWRSLFRVRYRYPSPVDRQRATTLLWMNGVAIIAWIAVTVFINLPELLSGRPEAVALVTTALPPLPLYLIYRWIQNGKLLWAARLFVALTIAGTIPTGLTDAGDLLALTLPVTAAGLLLNRRGIAVVVVVIAAISLTVFSVSDIVVPLDEFAVLCVLVVIDAAVLFAFNTDIGAFVYESLATTGHLEQIALFLSRRDVSDLEDEILAKGMQFVHDLFDVNLVQIYLLDDQGKLERRVRSGLGVDLVIVRQSFELDAASVIAEAVRTAGPVMVTPADNPIRRSHLMPATTVALAVPMIRGQKVIGVLDVQSAALTRFTATQITTLTLVANQIALMMSKGRVIEGTQRRLREQTAVADTLRGQLDQLQRIGRDDLTTTWADYLQRRGEGVIGFDLRPGEGAPISASDLPETLHSALKKAAVEVETRGDERIIKVPILLQGEALGAMAFTVPADQTVSERQLELAQDIAARLVQALETKRLFEQTEAQALRERKASETASLLISATDVRAVLNLAAESFNEALGAIRTEIYLQPGLLGEVDSPDGTARTEEVL